jgi:hypothetical protein
MRTLFSKDKSRFDLAKATARALVEQLREGDSLALVLASKPARVLIAPNQSVATLRRELESRQCTDRRTDLAAALALSHSLLENQPQNDKRVLLLSDLADDLPPPQPSDTNVLPELSVPAIDCAVLAARRRPAQILVELTCSSTTPTVERSLELVDSRVAKQALARVSFVPTTQGKVTFPESTFGAALEKAHFVRLVERDAIPQNDVAPLVAEDASRVIGYYSDPVTNRTVAGGSPIIEQALRAIEPDWLLHPLSTVPDNERELATLSVLLLDDPPALSVEARNAITTFARRGHTAFALFGPSASAAQLASLHQPFLEQHAEWQPNPPQELDRTTFVSPFSSLRLGNLAAKGRFVFDESGTPNFQVLARWSDQVPFFAEHDTGNGVLFVLGLPSSVSLSDFALRPGYLAILEHVVTEAERRGQGRVITVGDFWQFTREDTTVILGPAGNVVARTNSSTDKNDAPLRFVPEQIGRYQIQRGKETEDRFAIWPSEETLLTPRPWPVVTVTKTNQRTGQLDISRYIAVALVILLGLEVLFRLQGVKELGRTLTQPFPWTHWRR